MLMLLVLTLLLLVLAMLVVLVVLVLALLDLVLLVLLVLPLLLVLMLVMLVVFGAAALPHPYAHLILNTISDPDQCLDHETAAALSARLTSHTRARVSLPFLDRKWWTTFSYPMPAHQIPASSDDYARFWCR